MKVVDTHCDVLYKIQQLRKKQQSVTFLHDEALDVDLKKLETGKITIQFFAIFIHPNMHKQARWQAVLEQIQIFKRDVLASSNKIVHIRQWEEVEDLQSDQIGAILAIEGLSAIGFDLEKLEVLFKYGVLSVGLTWNEANLCADGVGASIGRGLTPFGKKVITLQNNHRRLTDVAHLSEQSFWEVLTVAKYPFVSHANAKAICLHPRNLTDEQIEALILKRGQIQLTFYPPFIKATKGDVYINDLLRHVEHICSLGGANYLGFGSDFDGIDQYIRDFSHIGYYDRLVNHLLKRYASAQVERFMGKNFLRFIGEIAQDRL